MKEKINKLTQNKNPYYIIILSTFAVYAKSLFFGFTYLDDNVLILDNLFFLRHLGNIFKSFQLEVFHVLHASAAYYRPVLTITFILDAQLSGPNPFIYHFTNIAIHAAVSCLLYLFLTKLDFKKEQSFIFTLLFAIHPVLTQAVSWIPGRNDSLLALFLLLSFISLIYYVENQKTKFLVLHSISFALAIFTKESAIFFPAIILYFLIFIKNNKVFSPKLINLYIIWPALIIVWFFMRSQALTNPVGYTFQKVFETVFKNFPAVLLFVGKIFIPINLSVLPTLQDSTQIYGVIVSIFLIVLFLVSYKNYKKTIFGLSWFFMFLLPSFIRPSDAYIADFIEHRVYVPIIGMIIFLLSTKPIQKLDFKKPIFFFSLLILIIAFAFKTFFYSDNFSNSIKFWQNAAQNSPHHPLAFKNLGAMYYLAGDSDDALKNYQESLILNPQETMVHNNIAVIYLDKGDYQKAISELDEEIKINPNYDRAMFNYGTAYYKMGEKSKAEDYWLKTLEINPDHTGALYNLAVLYKEEGNIEKSNYFLAILNQKL